MVKLKQWERHPEIELDFIEGNLDAFLDVYRTKTKQTREECAAWVGKCSVQQSESFVEALHGYLELYVWREYTAKLDELNFKGYLEALEKFNL